MIVAMAPGRTAWAQETATSRPGVPTIVTSGEAVVRHVPDVVYLTLTVESRARSPRDAQAANADAMSVVHRQVTNAGVPQGAWRTLGLWLQQEIEDSPGDRAVALESR
jgi:uncharacterized protein YggE